MRRPDYYPSEPSTNSWCQLIPGRTIGKDGKSYPHQRHCYNRTPRSPYSSSLVLEALQHARYGIRRADQIACKDGLTPRDMAALAGLFRQVSEVFRRWSSVSTAVQTGGEKEVYNGHQT